MNNKYSLKTIKRRLDKLKQEQIERDIEKIKGILQKTTKVNPKKIISQIIKEYPFSKGSKLLLKALNSGNLLKLEKERFISAYKMLEENVGKWVKIGARRVKTKLDTIEGRIKNDYNGDMDGLSTAPWIAVILVETFKNIIFNEKKRGQALMMTKT